jgi:prepilin signal peptidase PulO-like enzyme (type II secretory pathway)
MPVFDPLWFRLLAGLVVGLALGSFTTMLAYRIPRRISIVNPPSHCPHCRTPLKPRDLVPVFSWLIERGKCRHCQKPIPFRYLMVELVTMVLSVAAFIAIGFQPALIAALIGIAALVTLATINAVRD